MTATIGISDDLYQRVVAESVRQGRSVDAVASDMLQRALDDNEHASDLSGASIETRRQLAHDWLDEWLRMGEEASKNAPPGPSAREILDEGRNRLERR